MLPTYDNILRIDPDHSSNQLGGSSMRNFELSLSRRLSLALFAATLLVPTVTMAGSAVPFKASIAITELIQTGTGACYLTGDISGTGQATHLCHVTLVSH